VAGRRSPRTGPAGGGESRDRSGSAANAGRRDGGASPRRVVPRRRPLLLPDHEHPLRGRRGDEARVHPTPALGAVPLRPPSARRAVDGRAGSGGLPRLRRNGLAPDDPPADPLGHPGRDLRRHAHVSFRRRARRGSRIV
jgi:hypothetical protein